MESPFPMGFPWASNVLQAINLKRDSRSALRVTKESRDAQRQTWNLKGEGSRKNEEKKWRFRF
jgi:hypothetical protein